MKYRGNISSNFSNNSSELIENLEEIFPRYLYWLVGQHSHDDNILFSDLIFESASSSESFKNLEDNVPS